MSNGIKQGIAWTAIEKFSLQVVQFVIGVIIARFVTPDEYGILGVLMVFITISQVFIESGLGSALIYKNNLEEDDIQTTFTFNLVISCGIIVLIALLSTSIEQLMGVPNLASYLLVSVFVLIPNAFIVVPTSILKVKMNFKAIAVSNVVSTLISGLLGVITAVKGLGVWALVIQLLSKSLIQCLLIEIQCRWIPVFRFRKTSFINLYKYSFAIFGTSCISRITDQGISFFIARVLSPYSLGIFTRANQFASVACTSVGNIFSTVLFPAFSNAKSQGKNLSGVYDKMIGIQALCIIPMFCLLAVISKPIVLILLTDTWKDVILVLQILCIGRILSTISIATEQAICAVGRSDLEFKQQLFKLILKILLFIVGFKWGIIGIAISDAVSTLLSFFITNYYAKKCVDDFSVQGQLRKIIPFIMFSVVASFAAIPSIYLVSNQYLSGILSCVTFIFLYVLQVYLFKRDVFFQMLHQLSNSLK